MDKITRIEAAMFFAIGEQTKLSRSGQTLVFANPQGGRHDLSGREEFAEFQAKAAGLDTDALTDEQISTYEKWRDASHEKRRIAQARILVTRVFTVPRKILSGGPVWALDPVNRVTLVDGWGLHVDSVVVPCLTEWRASAINNMRGVGACCDLPDRKAIELAISGIRERNAEFVEARIQDNNAPDVQGQPRDTEALK